MKKIDKDYFISDDKNLMQIDLIHDYLSNIGYWSPDIPRFIVERAVMHSHSVGVFYKNEQVGFARLVTDYATFGYLADVFILETHRKKGLSKAMMTYIMEHPELKYLRRWMLITGDAHGLYQQYGFKIAKKTENIMEISTKNFYLQPKFLDMMKKEEANKEL